MKLFSIIFTITIICFIFLTNNTTVYSQKETNKQKLYIAAIKNQGQNQSISQRVHSVVKLSIFENFGTQFHVLDDEAIKIMYSQAEKIIASGNDDMSSLTQIANGLNADIIIYGEISRNNNGTINLSLNSLGRKNLNLGIKSIVKLTCQESQIDHYAIEAGKKLINPNYKILMNTETTFAYSTKVDGLDISIMSFTYSDDVINQMIIYLKELITKGDGFYYKREYEKALLIYSDVLDRIQKRLLPEQQSKLLNFVTELQNRIDKTYIANIEYQEKIGDGLYKEFKFIDSLENYSKCISISDLIFDNKKKIQLKNKFNKKIETVTETAHNYTTNIIKNHIDKALYLNLKDEVKPAKNSLLKAQVIIEKSGFTTGEMISTYNHVAKLLGVNKLYLSKIKHYTFKIGDPGPAGGIVFYDKGNNSNGWRYLEAAPEDECDVVWGCDVKSIIDTHGIAVGTGKSNTRAIVRNCYNTNSAAKICTIYRGGDESDWFLPSKDELNLMYKNLYLKKMGYSEPGNLDIKL